MIDHERGRNGRKIETEEEERWRGGRGIEVGEIHQRRGADGRAREVREGKGAVGELSLECCDIQGNCK